MMVPPICAREQTDGNEQEQHLRERLSGADHQEEQHNAAAHGSSVGKSCVSVLPGKQFQVIRWLL